MKLLEQVRVDFKQVERCGIRQRRRFHEAQQQKQVVQLRGLLAKVVLVAADGRAVKDVADTVEEVHLPTSTLKRTAMPPRSFSLRSFEMPDAPRMPDTRVNCTSAASEIHC